MKLINNNIFSHIAVSFIALISLLQLFSCNKEEQPQKKTKEIVNTELKVNKAEAITPSKVEIYVVEGHLHTKCNPVGDVFWAETNGGFHANPTFDGDTYPLKRHQLMTYTLQEDGSYKVSGENAIRLLTTFENGTKGGGHQYALILRMYDKSGNRLDREYCSADMANRVQVFYIPKNIEPLGEDRPLGRNANTFKTDSLFYYWYFDRVEDINVTQNSPVLRNPVGFRGAFINLEGIMKYDVDILVSIMPKGKSKGTHYNNSVSPTMEQQKHIVFKLTVPFRNVAKDITPFKTPEMSQDDFDALQYNDHLRLLKNLEQEFGMSQKDIQNAEIKRAFLSAESSQFWL